ncbi:S49 family peptidase [Candidatus Dependentiae bacterium]|nr:S49 family peptidase [Candidatus Dependentiae bacterium]
MNTRSGLAYVDVLKNIFFTLLFIQVLPFLVVGIKSTVEAIVKNKVEIGYISLHGDIADAVSYTKRIEEFASNSSIKGLIIRVDAAGGLPGSSQAIFHSLRSCKTKKPVVVCVENLCTAGAYYAVCSATKIIAHESALIGSVGRSIKVTDSKELLDWWLIKSDKSDSLMEVELEKKEKKKKEIQHLYNDFYKQFVHHVAAQRQLDEKLDAAWAQGKIFTGNEALHLKLIDSVGSYGDGLDCIANLLQVDRAKIKLISSTQGIKGFMRRFLEGEGSSGEMNIAKLAPLILGI